MQITDEKLWGRISMTSILLYVTLGGGSEILTGIKNHHVGSTLLFSSLSCLIFVGRIFYAISSKAKRTIIADIYGAVVMLAISLLHLHFN